MKQLQVIGLFSVLFAIEMSDPAQSYGATFADIGFDQMIERSEVIVQGRVVMLESTWSRGTDPADRIEQYKDSHSPKVQPSDTSKEISGIAAAPPVAVDTEGGQMIFTRVTFETLEDIKGSHEWTFEFLVAGGTLDGRTAIVPGIPQFQEGERYVLFLRQGYQQAADPIMGVNQGFFHVVAHPSSGQDVLLNADADYVLGVENDRVMLRRNPGPSAAPILKLIDPPLSDDPQVETA